MFKTRIKKNILLLVYALSFLAFTYCKLQQDVIYMLLFKVFVFTSLILFYVVNANKLNIPYLLAMALLTIADLSEIYFSGNFVIAISFFFASSIILIFLISEKMKRANLDSFISKNALNFCLSLLIMFGVFMYLNKISYYIIGLATSLLTTFCFAFIYYSKSAKRSSFWLLGGITLLIISFSFGRIDGFVIPYKYYSLIDTATYALGLFCICNAVLFEEKEFLEF